MCHYFDCYVSSGPCESQLWSPSSSTPTLSHPPYFFSCIHYPPRTHSPITSSIVSPIPTHTFINSTVSSWTVSRDYGQPLGSGKWVRQELMLCANCCWKMWWNGCQTMRRHSWRAWRALRYVCVCVWVSECVCVCDCVCECVYVCMWVCVCMCVYVNACVKTLPLVLFPLYFAHSSHPFSHSSIPNPSHTSSPLLLFISFPSSPTQPINIYEIGRTKVYFSTGVLEFLESLRGAIVHTSAKVIQRTYRGSRQRRLFWKMKR
jgi:hypothetical protein